MATTVTPPRARPPKPRQDEPEALIEEARQRQRRRRRRGIAGIAVALAALGAAAYGIVATSLHHTAAPGLGGAAAAKRDCPGIGLGLVAFIRSNTLNVVNLQSCRTRTLVRGHGVGSPSFSSDGRYVAFGGGYVSTEGGPIHQLAGVAVWSPRSDVLAVASRKGGLELLNARNGTVRRLLPDGWGAGEPVFSANGTMLAVTRHAKPRRALEPIPGRLINPWGLQIWLINIATGTRRLVLPRAASNQPIDLSFAPDGRWLIAHDLPDSASLAADGMPLVAINVETGQVTEIGLTLGDPNMTTWCGDKLVYATDFGGRISTMGEGVAAAAPPSWQPRTILPAGGNTSWNSLACTSSNRLLIAAGPASEDSPFGQEHRTLYELSLTKSAQPKEIGPAAPPAQTTDELPLWSANGHWLLFVRTKPSGTIGRGSLFAVDLATDNLVGPIANLGETGNYYGSYAWAHQIVWHR